MKLNERFDSINDYDYLNHENWLGCLFM